MESHGVLLDARHEAGAIWLQKDSLSLAFTTLLLRWVHVILCPRSEGIPHAHAEGDVIKIFEPAHGQDIPAVERQCQL